MLFDLDKSVAILERTPATLTALLHDLPDDWTQGNYGPDTWSAHAIVGHLIYGERTDWIPRTRHILEYGESKVFEPFDMTGHEAICSEKSLDELLSIFKTERSENLTALRSMNLGDSDFAKRSLHPEFGRVTLGQMLATWVAHDLHHIGQICKAMARQYKDEVGPWGAYLSILTSPVKR